MVSDRKSPSGEIASKGQILSPASGRLIKMPALERMPWWGLILIICAVFVVYSVFVSPNYQETLLFLADGISVTIQLSVLAYAFALVLGLITGLGRVSKNPIIYTIATLYVEVIRGVPLLVLLIYIAFVVAPILGLRDDALRAILGLGIGYGAYLGEVYRAGIESIPRGQMEAARSLGMNYLQAMRYIILPQAIRVILPPLGNDFIAMLKDTSLASAISVPELMLLGRMNNSRTFRSFETFTMVALIYLVMTLVLSAGVRWLERKSSGGR